MDKPELYSNSNAATRAGAVQCLDEYASKIKWVENGARVIDLGCGDGSVTCILKKYIPKSYEKFVACDISATMIEYARKRYANENITFQVFNLEGDVPDDMICDFDHVFSFYVLHWIQDQEKGFKNIYNILKAGGDCLLSFVAYNPINNLYDIIGQDQSMKWGSIWLKDLRKFVSIYCHLQDPQSYITELMKKIGFSNIEVHCKQMTYNFQNVVALKRFVKSLEPYGMPDDVFEEFFQDFMQVGKLRGIFDKGNNDLNKEIVFKYNVIIIYAVKS